MYMYVLPTGFPTLSRYLQAFIVKLFKVGTVYKHVFYACKVMANISTPNSPSTCMRTCMSHKPLIPLGSKVPCTCTNPSSQG